MKLQQVLLLAFVVQVAAFRSVILSSSRTPADLTQAIDASLILIQANVQEAFGADTSVTVIQKLIQTDAQLDSVLEQLEREGVHCVFVATVSIPMSRKIDQVLGKFQITVISLSGDEAGISPNTFRLSSPTLLEAQALLSVIQKYQWTSSAIFSGETSSFLEIANYLINNLKPKYQSTASDIVADEVILNMISTGVKAYGARILTLATTGSVAKSALAAAETKFVAGEGYGFLLGVQAALFETTADMTEPIFSDGVLFVSEEGLESVTSEAMYQVGLMEKVMVGIGWGHKLGKSVQS